eukprot:COSAG02_NODE_22361_length_755_cov_0.907012_1_plen_22_part_10
MVEAGMVEASCALATPTSAPSV